MPLKARVAATLVLFTACIDPFAPPMGTHRFDPPTLYRDYWRAVEDCSALRGDFERVRWYAVPEAPFPCPVGSGYCHALWREPHDIFLERTAPYLIVGHEMLHDLLRRGDHPDVFRTCGLVRDSSAIGGG